jgi:hypothetical protein
MGKGEGNLDPMIFIALGMVDERKSNNGVSAMLKFFVYQLAASDLIT